MSNIRSGLWTLASASLISIGTSSLAVDQAASAFAGVEEALGRKGPRSRVSY